MSNAMRGVMSLALAAVMSLMSPGTARSDVVSDWNLVIFQVGGGGGRLTRAMAMAHIAMFDAVNATGPRYQAYLDGVPDGAGASPEAAAVGAAYGVLVRLYPAQVAALDAAKATSLAAIPDGPAKTLGLAVGDEVAAAIVEGRADDHWLDANPAYVFTPGPGVYEPTPPAFVPPVNVGAATWRPFALATAAQFRPNGPAKLHTGEYARDLAETRELGSATSLTRTVEQSLIAQWHTETATPAFNRIARILAADHHPDLLDNARTFALINIAIADATISCFEAKYVFASWRPITAIRRADTDGNPRTVPDPDWTPFIATPPHPEYPAAHGVISSAPAEIIRKAYGNQTGFTTTSAGVPGVSRTFESARAFLDDATVARIYGGMHFRTALREGVWQGRKVGRWILETTMRPLE
jgi:hypothetical protein